MSSFPRVRNPGRSRSIVVASLVAVVLAVAMMLVVVRFVSERPDEVNLGDRVFAVGDAERLAKRIDEDRAPFLFKDPLTSGAGREVYVQHLGTEAEKGWLAIEAYAPTAPREVRCVLQWDRAAQEFRDPCGGPRFPADGAGLRTYPATVEDGDVVVDLRPANP